MSAAWFCPSCQKHHAPHVDTCPAGEGGNLLAHSLDRYREFQRMQGSLSPARLDSCACGLYPDQTCASASCPRRGSCIGFTSALLVGAGDFQ